MRRLLIISFGFLAVTGVVRAARVPPRVESSAASILPPPYIYFSNTVNHCITISGTETIYFIYVHAPDYETSGVSFDLQLSGAYMATIPEPLIFGAGATLTSLDTSSMPYHIEGTWTPQFLSHAPMFMVYFLSNPELQYSQAQFNVEFSLAGGGTVEGVGIDSFVGCCVDCFPCGTSIYVEDQYAPAGATTELPFAWSWSCYAAGGNFINVSDTQGWVSSWWPTQSGDNETCSPCVIPRHYGAISVTVPPETPPGTTSTVTVSTSSYPDRSFVVEVEGIVRAEHTTWGRIKALYR